MQVKVCIHEHLERVIVVEAEMQEEAENKVENAYKNGHIVLNADDFCEYSIETL